MKTEIPNYRKARCCANCIYSHMDIKLVDGFCVGLSDLKCREHGVVVNPNGMCNDCEIALDLYWKGKDNV